MASHFQSSNRGLQAKPALLRGLHLKTNEGQPLDQLIISIIHVKEYLKEISNRCCAIANLSVGLLRSGKTWVTYECM